MADGFAQKQTVVLPQGFDKNLFGFINIYKPKGMTSHDVVGILRRITGIKQIGHTGTLDPFAEGVLPVCIGKATRLIEYLNDDKEYIATVKFGSNTETYDLEGKVTETFDTKVSRDALIQALQNFEGEISQIPPLYSAIKVNGKRLYEYARKGENVEVKPRQVTIFKIELKAFDEENQTADILIACSKGTYIRSIAYDLGKLLNCGGHLVKLVRTRAGSFMVGETSSLENLRGYPELVKENLINPREVLELPQIEINDFEHDRVLHGMAIDNKTNYADFVILIYNKIVSAVGLINDKKILIKKVFE